MDVIFERTEVLFKKIKELLVVVVGCKPLSTFVMKLDEFKYTVVQVHYSFLSLELLIWTLYK